MLGGGAGGEVLTILLQGPIEPGEFVCVHSAFVQLPFQSLNELGRLFLTFSTSRLLLVLCTAVVCWTMATLAWINLLNEFPYPAKSAVRCC